MENYNTSSSARFLLLYHLIFVCKYRKKLLTGQIKDFVKREMVAISEKCDFEIRHIESDEDHIHLMVSSKPKVSCSQIARVLKQETTVRLWKRFGDLLKWHFWKERTFWSDGYFVSSIGNVSQETLRRYIESQGS